MTFLYVKFYKLYKKDIYFILLLYYAYIVGGEVMRLVSKVIQLDKKDKEYLDRTADLLGMSTNQLIRMILKDYINGRK